MYLPSHFREDRIEAQHALIRAHPLATLITAGPAGLLANPVPVRVYPDEGPFGTLRLHLARANPHWQELAAVGECLLVFTGPQAYVSPSWYPTKALTGKVVPTWNYATVHAWGRPTVHEGAPWLARLLRDLTHQQEDARPQPWRVDDAPADFVAAQMRAIVGVEVAIGRIEGKWKVSQNRGADDRNGVEAGLRTEPEGGLAAAMADLLQSKRL